MAFKLSWIHPLDVTYVGRGRYKVGCIYIGNSHWGNYVYNVVVEMKC